jgi:polyhydroxyalkanoate synthase
MTTIGRRRQVRIVEAAHERAASPKPPEPVELPPPEAPWLEDPIDRATHAFIAKMSGGFSPMGLTEAWFDWAIHLGVSPARQWQIGSSAVQAAAQLATLASRGAAGAEDCHPDAHALPQDRRFRDSAWQQWPFALQAEAHLAAERWWDEATRNVHGASRHHLELLNFVGRQLLDIFAPSNFIASNPEVQRATLESGGMNFVRGLGHAAEDLRRTLLKQPIEGVEAFVPGQHVAVTPGAVVRRTRLAEIIQYAPATGAVRPEPIVIVPAWIMKYYILDLSPNNSLVSYLVAQGFTVFMISWKNPEQAERDVGLDDYRTEGVMPLLETALAVTGASRVHAVGYCIGGTLLAVAAAALARAGDDRLATLSLFAAQTDFEEAGELRLFIDESQVAFLEDIMWDQGYLDVRQMAGAFQMLRSNDLIWSSVLRQYLLGERQPVTDLMAWNTDGTRLPYRMHRDYLHRLFLGNDLAEGRYLVDDRPVTLRDIRVPIFCVATLSDHIAPWRSVYKIHLLTDAEITFVLTSGGHNAGIVSEPGHPGRHFQIARRHDGGYGDPETWRAATAVQEGSWWPEWQRWLAQHSSAPAGPPPMGAAGRGYPPLGEAPGTYVLQE